MYLVSFMFIELHCMGETADIFAVCYSVPDGFSITSFLSIHKM